MCVSRISSYKFTSYKYSMADVSPPTRVKRRRTNDVNVFYTYSPSYARRLCCARACCWLCWQCWLAIRSHRVKGLLSFCAHDVGVRAHDVALGVACEGGEDNLPHEAEDRNPRDLELLGHELELHYLDRQPELQVAPYERQPVLSGTRHGLIDGQPLHEASESKEERIVDQRNDLIEAVVLRSGTLAQGRGARQAIV